MAYPTSLDSFTANVDNVDVIYASDINELQTAITSLETKVGVDSSAVTSSHDYKLGEITSTDKAVGKTATQTVANKTLGTGTKVAIGSDADKDMYYRASDGSLTRIPVGTDNQILKLNGTTPNWEAETVVVAATESTEGISRLATAAQITAGTASEASFPLVITPDQLALSTPVFNGSGLTNLPVPAATAGTHVVAKSEAEVFGPAINTTVYQKAKEIVCGKTGTFSIYFELKAQSTYTAYGKIYKNGSAVGTERSTTSTSYVSFSENISFVYGDLIQIYVKNSADIIGMYTDKLRISEAAWEGADTY